METIHTVEKFLTGVETLGPGALLIVVMIAIGYGVRVSAINNRFIPWIVAIGGSVLYMFLGPSKQLQSEWEYPLVAQAIYGFVYSMGAWLIHAQVLSRVEDMLQAKGLLPKSLQSQPPDSAGQPPTPKQ